MKRTYKKALSLLSSAAIAATMIAVPVTAGAAGATASYADGTLTVTADKAYSSADVYVVSYNADNTLKSVTKTPVSLAEGENTMPVEAEEGDRILIWNGQEPIVTALEIKAAEETDNPTETATDPAETEAPTETEAATDDPGVLKSWKFDFGSAEDVAEGYTAVTTDINYVENQAYGFIGTNENDYKLAGDRIDGFTQQQGQVITLEAGGSTGLNDGIGSVGEDTYGNAGDKYYPVRFALKVEDETYYRVKATVTTLDSTKPAVASLYTERKHPLYTEKEIPAGETVTTEFTVRVTPIYYQKSDPQGAIADGMVNVAVLGENTALAALEIDQIETAPTLWVLGDSTVTDGGGTLPFWPLQNYTGVGTGLAKYLPSDIALVNEGEGGLNAADSLHFNMVSSRIKAGDYMYVEYGHNHKDDGVAGYQSCLDKYYDVCRNVGATLILVGPIDRHNSSQYDASTNTWSSTLSGFSDAAKAYVDEKIAAGATDIAFVDLNKPSLDWYTTLSAKGTVNDTEVTNNYALTNYYFQTSKGGGTDGTHPNDTGAENLAYFFFTTADTTAYPALLPLMKNFEEGAVHETPTSVSDEVINLGYPSNDAWPTYNKPVEFEYPIVIKDVSSVPTDSGDDTTTVLTAYVQDSFSNYASGVLEIYNEDGTLDGTYVTIDHIDNTTGTGTNTLHFADGVYVKESQTYKAYMWSCYLDKEELIPEEDGGVQLSAVYEPTDIEAYIVPGEDGGVETFDFYGKTALTDNEKYIFGGSAGHDFTLGKDSSGTTYTRIMSDGAKNGSSGQGSFYIMRPLENLEDGTGASGRYMIDVDLQYVSGGGLNFGFAKATTPAKSPFVTDGGFTAFTIADGGKVTVDGTEVGAISGTGWTNVKYILDMSSGIATISVAGGTAVEIPITAYQTFGTPSPDTLKHFIIEGQKVAFDLNVSNMTVAKLKDSGNTTTLSVSVDGETADDGEVYINEAGITEVTVSQSAVVTAYAAPKSGFVFVEWLDEDGNTFSTDEEIDIRLYRDLALKAVFAEQGGVSDITSYGLSADKPVVKAADGATVSITAVDVVDNAGNPVAFEASDVTWSCDETGVTVDNGVVTLGSDFEIDENTIKDVTLKAVLNNIEKTYDVTVYSYEFYENVKDGKVSSAAWDGDILTIANTKTGIMFPAGGGTYTLTLNDAVTLDAATSLSYIAGGNGTNSCGQPRYIEIYDSNGAKVINEVIGYSWNLLYIGGTVGGSSIDGSTGSFESAFALGVWNTSPVEITINTDGTGTVSFNGSSVDITVNSEAVDIASIKFISKSGAPDYLNRALGFTDITIKK